MEYGTISQIIETERFALEESPTQTVTTQTNHFFAALCEYIKLHHFVLKAKLYLQALHSAFETLRGLGPVKLTA